MTEETKVINKSNGKLAFQVLLEPEMYEKIRHATIEGCPMGRGAQSRPARVIMQKQWLAGVLDFAFNSGLFDWERLGDIFNNKKMHLKETIPFSERKKLPAEAFKLTSQDVHQFMLDCINNRGVK